MTELTPDLAWLLATLLLAGSLWIPYIVGVNLHPQPGVDLFRRPYDGTGYPDWVSRANRAHLNALEQVMPFAGVVLLAHVAGVVTPLMGWVAGAFFLLRVLHAAGMISGLARLPVRPLIYVGGWLCILIVAEEVVRLG